MVCAGRRVLCCGNGLVSSSVVSKRRNVAREGGEMAGQGRKRGKQDKDGKKWLFAVRVALEDVPREGRGAFF